MIGFQAALETVFPIGNDFYKLLVLAGAFLNRGWQGVGLVVLAVRRNLCRIALQAVVVQDVAVGGGIVITAHPKADEIPVLRTVSEPISASDLIHI